MKRPPSLLAPRPGVDPVAPDLFSAKDAPGPADFCGPRLLVACPSPKVGAQRYRMPMWRLFDQPGK